jgi:hypothetical protein
MPLARTARAGAPPKCSPIARATASACESTPHPGRHRPGREPGQHGVAAERGLDPRRDHGGARGDGNPRHGGVEPVEGVVGLEKEVPADSISRVMVWRSGQPATVNQTSTDRAVGGDVRVFDHAQVGARPG